MTGTIKEKKYSASGVRVTRGCALGAIVASAILLSLHWGTALAVTNCDSIIFEGGGAGRGIFDVSIHAGNGLSCEDCHEGSGLIPALFSMKRGDGDVSMRSMEKGRSCGFCHKVSLADTLTCNYCHHK